MQTPRFFRYVDGSYMMFVAPPITLDQFLYEIVGLLEGTQVRILFQLQPCPPQNRLVPRQRGFR